MAKLIETKNAKLICVILIICLILSVVGRESVSLSNAVIDVGEVAVSGDNVNSDTNRNEVGGDEVFDEDISNGEAVGDVVDEFDETNDGANADGGVDDTVTDAGNANAQGKYILTLIRSRVNSLCVRSAASSTSSVLGYLDKGDCALYVSDSGKYYVTLYKGQKAYVYADYCSFTTVDCVNSGAFNAVKFGCSLLGFPYVYGSQRYHWGNGILNPNFVYGEFDCSSLTQYIYYKSAGVLLNTTTRTQVYDGVAIAASALSCGDLMLFTNSSRYYNLGVERIGHVAIYLGNNLILHTASDHAVIEEISTVRQSYYVCARRVL